MIDDIISSIPGEIPDSTLMFFDSRKRAKHKAISIVGLATRNVGPDFVKASP
jgi:hypothetical protein